MEIIIRPASDIWLTRRKAALSDLALPEKHLVPANTRLSLLGCRIDGDHLAIELETPIDGQSHWYMRSSPESTPLESESKTKASKLDATGLKAASFIIFQVCDDTCP